MSGDAPKVSVVVSDMEVIVVDDGSTDETAEIVKRYDVRYFHQPNQGPATARNNGAWQARGEIVIFTDSDCVPRPDFVERLARAFDDPETAAAQGAYETFQPEIVARFAQIEFEDRYELMKRYDDIDLVATYAAAYPLDVFREMNGFDESFPAANNEDTELSYRLAAAGRRMVFVPDAIVAHQHPATLLRYLRIKFWRGYWRIVVYRKFPGKAVKDRYTTSVVKLQTLGMLGVLGCLVVGLVWPPLWWLALAGVVLVAATSLPFAAWAWKRDRGVGVAAPGIVLLRSVVFAAGSLRGLLACLIRK